ncbi:MAG: XTP/dITP diphosphatase [Candidatus Bathyarchaeota archaeon]|nr:XTP/dITP diphosphatase [Candidatus Bathyarchaeota archaeon]
MSEVYFATSNIGKLREIESLALKYDVKVRHLNFKGVEVQSESLEQIALASLKSVLDKYHLPIFVEDSGLFISSLKGFPGPYSSYIYKTIGFEGILKLMFNVKNRKAYFLSVIAFGSPNIPPKVFKGKVDGVIVGKPHGRYGFGFDPIFKPKNSRKTFAEMSVEEKNRFSHRGKAFKAFFRWFKASFNSSTKAYQH